MFTNMIVKLQNQGSYIYRKHLYTGHCVGLCEAFSKSGLNTI